MIFFNGSLESQTGNIPALFFIHLTAFTLSGLLFLKKNVKVQREKKSRLYLLAGLLGIIVVSITNKVFMKGGVLLALSGTFAGQVFLATIMEWFKYRQEEKKMPWTKFFSLFCIIPGSLWLGYRSQLPLQWILLSWVPGILILAQSWLNSQNILSVGVRITLLFHFGSVLLLLAPLFLISYRSEIMPLVLTGEVPLQNLTGGGFMSIFVISLGSYLLLKIKPVTYVLLLYSGQLAAALILDSFQGYDLSLEKVVGVILIIAGLFIGEVKKGNSSE